MRSAVRSNLLRWTVDIIPRVLAVTLFVIVHAGYVDLGGCQLVIRGVDLGISHDVRWSTTLAGHPASRGYSPFDVKSICRKDDRSLCRWSFDL